MNDNFATKTVAIPNFQFQYQSLAQFNDYLSNLIAKIKNAVERIKLIDRPDNKSLNELKFL